MIKIFKSLGLGVFIVLTSPLWAIALVLFIIAIIIRYFIGEILSLIYFFKGYNYTEEDEYDNALYEAMDDEEILKEKKKQQKTIYVQAVPEKYIDPRFFNDNLDEEDGESDD